MAANVLNLGKTVLMMSEEALYVYSVTAQNVRLVEGLSWDVDDFESNLSEMLVKECGKKPVIILNDMVEQHYRKERILKKGVSVMDRSAMLERKMRIAFPNYPVRAALNLKHDNQKTKKNAKQGPANSYIFAAIPSSEQFTRMLSAVRRSLVAIVGVYLLPVESSELVHTLSEKIRKTANKKGSAKWAVFLGQHKSGGLRQIVVRDGEIALTRMTLITDDHSNVRNWVEDVHQEFEATMSYLNRFGYKDDDELDVILISDPEAGDMLENIIGERYNFTAMTAPQAANMLGIKIGAVEAPYLSDLLHVGWAGKKKKFLLPMKSALVDRISKPRRAATFSFFALAAAALFFGYQVATTQQKIMGINNQYDEQLNRKAQLEVSYQREVKRKEDLGFDVELIQNSLLIFKALEKANMNYLKLVQSIGYALGRDLRIDQLTVEKKDADISNIPYDYGEAYAQPSENQEQNKEAFYTARMYMTYPSTTDINRGNQEVKELRDRLAERLPEDNVEVNKFLKDYEYVEEVIVESGDVQKQNINQDYVAEITISGANKND